MREYVICSVCRRKYAGKTPKGGDGSIMFPRKHHRFILSEIVSEEEFLKNQNQIICDGSYQEALSELSQK